MVTCRPVVPNRLYISQLVRFVIVSSHVTEINAREKLIKIKLSSFRSSDNLKRKKMDHTAVSNIESSSVPQ